ncbi:MAG: di-heme enzyme, partial [Nannocystaceae bacterium]
WAYQGDDTAMSLSAKRGLNLFFSEQLECFHCHGGFNFALSTTFEGLNDVPIAFQNTGLYNLDGEGAYPADATGLYEFTGEPGDMGKFRTMSLRNITVTGPYLHDGTASTLDEVLDIYAAGGRVIESGENMGDGTINPHKSGFVNGFVLTDQQRIDVTAFLESLTDETFLTDPALSNPFTASGSN